MCFLHSSIKAEHQRNYYGGVLPKCMYCINNHCCLFSRSTFGLRHCLLILHFQLLLYCRLKYDLEKLFQWCKAWMHFQDVTCAIAMSPVESCFRSVLMGAHALTKFLISPTVCVRFIRHTMLQTPGMSESSIGGCKARTESHQPISLECS